MTPIYISLGSNNEPEYHLREAIRQLQFCFAELRVSPVYETEAVGFAGDNFLNCVAEAQTDESPEAVQQRLKGIESAMGRTPTEKGFVSRGIDLDLLLYGDLQWDTDTLVLPRDEIWKYRYVAQPLADLAADRLIPGRNQTAAELLRDGKFSDVWIGEVSLTE